MVDPHFFAQKFGLQTSTYIRGYTVYLGKLTLNRRSTPRFVIYVKKWYRKSWFGKVLAQGGNIPFLAEFIKKSSTFGLVYAKTVIFRAKKHRDNLVQNLISNTFCLNNFLVRFTIPFRKKWKRGGNFDHLNLPWSTKNFAEDF